MQAGLAATVLAALMLSLMLFYAMGCAVTTRNAYAGMALRRDIENLRAQNALLQFQINLTESNQRMQQTAANLGLRPADPVQEVDYVLLPHSEPESGTQVAAAGAAQEPGGLAAVLAELATEVVSSARGRAEASTAQGHRP